MGKSRKRQQQQIRKKREELLRQNSCRGKTNRTLASSGNPTDVKTTKTIPSTTQAAEVTTSLQQILEDVLADLLAWSKSSNIPFDDFRYRSEGNAKSWKPWSVKRWKTRLGDILDTLKSYGFRFDQILKAVSTIIASMSSGKDHYNQWITAPYHHFLTVECVLDWLCLHLPSDQLPAIFTEGQVRDDNRIGKESMTVTVITAKHQTSHQNDLELDKLQPPTTKLSTLKDRSSSVPKKDDDEEQKWKVAQKDWLLSQYQYEEESLSEESNSDNDSYEQPSMIPASESPTTETEEQRLHQLKKLIQELDEDLGNEASNYMRSKFEIKELHKELKLMRQQLSGMERKMERQSAKSKAALKDETDESKEKEEQDDDPFFSLFDEDAVTLRQDHQPTGTDTDIHGQLHQSFPEIDWEERIPKSWTGKTPKILLQEWCQKEQLPKPSYEKLESNGCRLIVHKTLSEQIEVEALGPFSKYNDAQHLASTKALYQIQTNLPLYHLLPPYYRTLWLSWRETDKAEISKDGAARERNRQNEIEQLLQCLPMDVPSHGTFQPITKMNYKEEHGNSKPCRISSPAETKHNADKKTTRNFQEIQKRSAYQKMLRFRKQLPIYQSKQMILETIKRNSVSIICAETGSGKTTQCSSFILEEALSDGKGNQTMILCTQPRRVAAISVAERVSDEWTVPLGDLVGYQIRMESRKSADTRILFCTTGVVLRRLIDDPSLKGVTHVVVDEVHERQWQVDILLLSLRKLLHGSRPDLKILLMSATLDARLFSSYFMDAPVVNVSGKFFPVSTFYLEDLLEKTGHMIEEGSRCAKRKLREQDTVSMLVTTRRGEKQLITTDYDKVTDLTDEYLDYTVSTRNSMKRVDETIINYDLIEDVLMTLFQADSTAFSTAYPGKVDGAVLIFLPGIGEIRNLLDRLSGSRFFGDSRRFRIVALHSTLSSSDQRFAFRLPPKGCQKIILSTNIAETSVTIPDVVVVIDSGRVRELCCDRRGVSRQLVTTWCSRASAKQRTGRAGRTAPGLCLRLFSRKTEKEVMKMDSEPELRRIPLEEVCLSVLAGGQTESCQDFLRQTLQPPADVAVRSALQSLEEIGAIKCPVNNLGETHLSATEHLTGLGKHLAMLPVDARIGKMLIFGSIFKCVDVVLTLAAFLSASKSPFSVSVELSQEAKSAHKSFAHENSDFFTLIKVWDAFTKASDSQQRWRFCQKNFLSYSTMCEINEARQNFFDLLCDSRFLDPEKLEKNDGRLGSLYYNINSNEATVHAVICAGFYPNVAILTSSAYEGQIALHKNKTFRIQSSVNTNRTPSSSSLWITFFEKFETERKAFISKTAFVSPFCLMLFGSKFKIFHTRRKVLIDDWIELSSAAKTSLILGEIRDRLEFILTTKIDDLHSARASIQEEKLEMIINKIAKIFQESVGT